MCYIYEACNHSLLAMSRDLVHFLISSSETTLQLGKELPQQQNLRAFSEVDETVAEKKSKANSTKTNQNCVDMLCGHLLAH